jgi:hypothetical protein
MSSPLPAGREAGGEGAGKRITSRAFRTLRCAGRSEMSRIRSAIGLPALLDVLFLRLAEAFDKLLALAPGLIGSTRFFVEVTLTLNG